MQQTTELKIKPDYVYIICGAYRPNTDKFIYTVEHTLFPPTNEELNDLFDIFVMPFADLLYVVMGIPQKYLEKCKKIATSLNLELILGKPIGHTAGGSIHFPLDHSSDLIYTVENR